MPNVRWILSASLIMMATQCFAATIDSHTEQQLQELSQKSHVPYSALHKAVEQAQFQPKVLAAINRPYEAKPWYQYQKLFVTQSRIEQGVAFWKKYQPALERAQKQYQVPAQVIVAIIGVETRYGQHKGQYSVLNSLYTLGFHYPKRSRFFSREFASFVRLSQQQNWNYGEIKGSYAGAMGYGQFIPSSYLHYAVDFDHDGHIDLINNPIDAIGSVANYFHQHHWTENAPVAITLNQVTTAMVQKANKKRELPYQWQQFSANEPPKAADIAATTPVNLLDLSTSMSQKEYWITFHNFYVITRYNTSPLYAMAVYQLSQQIKHAYHK
ncbi:lytic murein transglycosylase B [Celerinatantimonas yamalensis]|uniref:Lytic murein transglycosylase B n=1 Tax=Celerinatantimonas yamalensis TaxID=559956 RepID=A0ABW9GAQ9_9GAMM